VCRGIRETIEAYRKASLGQETHTGGKQSWVMGGVKAPWWPWGEGINWQLSVKGRTGGGKLTVDAILRKKKGGN